MSTRTKAAIPGTSFLLSFTVMRIYMNRQIHEEANRSVDLCEETLSCLWCRRGN